MRKQPVYLICTLNSHRTVKGALYLYLWIWTEMKCLPLCTDLRSEYECFQIEYHGSFFYNKKGVKRSIVQIFLHTRFLAYWWKISKLDRIREFGLSKKATIVWHFCLIGNIRHNFLVSRMNESAPKTFMSIQTPDLNRVKCEYIYLFLGIMV